MPNQPLVSVLMSAYNAGKYIHDALDSALRQTYANFEIVVIDAGSTDRTPLILSEYAKRDQRIRHFRHGYEQIIRTRNNLLKEARGEYFTFLDADDIYLPGKVEEEVRFLEKNVNYGAVYCDLRYFFDGAPERLYRHRYAFRSGDLFEMLLDKMFITNTTFMIRREVAEKLGGYNEALGLVEDWDYFLRLAHEGYRIGFLQRDLVRYRLRWDNHTRFEKQVPIQESAVKIFEDLRSAMSVEERKRYRIDERVGKRKKRLTFALLAEGKKRDAWRIVRTIKWGVVLAPLFLTPSFLLRLVVKQMWKFKKKRLFLPIPS